MALFGLSFSRTKSPTFHVEDLNKRSKLRANRTMTNTRLVGTAAALLLGGFMCYTATHYLPALLGTSKIISFSDLDSAALRMAPTQESRNFIAPYIDLFEVKRTYLRPGQSVQAQYDLPGGSVVELRIRQCQKVFIKEVFECNVTGEKIMRVANKRSGSHEFTFQKGGFYMFDERIIKLGNGETSGRVTWRRS